MCESLTAQPPGARGACGPLKELLISCIARYLPQSAFSTFSVLVSVLLGLAHIFLLYIPVPVLDDVLIFSVYF